MRVSFKVLIEILVLRLQPTAPPKGQGVNLRKWRQKWSLASLLLTV